MRRFTRLVVLALVASVGTLAWNLQVVRSQEVPQGATVAIQDARGTIIGNALLTAVGEGAVRVQV